MLPLVIVLLIIYPSPYLSKWIGRCGKGYLTTSVVGYCQPICHDLCQDHAYCIAPDVCQCMTGYEIIAGSNACVPVSVCAEKCVENSCQLGYFWMSKTNSCASICDEAYIWNAATASCEHRCKSGISWDVETRTCVQKLNANVELIVEEEVNKVLLLEAGEDSTEGAGDGNPDILFDLATAVGTCNTTNCGADSKTTICLSFFSMLLAFAIVTLLMALGCLGNYFWKRRVIQQVETLNVKHMSQEEYMLDRSQILVY